MRRSATSRVRVYQPCKVAAMTPGAVCADHPAVPSIGTCNRCGRFMCTQCRPGDALFCTQCLPLATDPLGVLASPFSLQETLRNGFRMFFPVMTPVVIISLVFSVPGGLMTAALAGASETSNLRVTNIYDALVG